MRIVVVPSWYPTEANPVLGTFVREQVRALSEQHDVAVIYPRVVGREELRSGRFLEELTVSEDDGVIVARPRVSVLPQAFQSERGFLSHWRSAIEAGLEYLVPEFGRPDVVHAHVCWPAGAAVVGAARRRGFPVVITEHTAPFSALLENAVRAAAVDRGLSQAGAIVAVSPGLAAQIGAHAEAAGISPVPSVTVVGNVVDGDRFTLKGGGRPQAVIELLTVGNLIPKKGHILLLRAVAQLRRDLASAMHLTLVGSGPEREALERAARELGVADLVTFVPRLTGDALVQAFQSADLFVLPSLTETFGVVVAEAMACGTPVVVTRCGGPEWFVTDEAGAVVEPGSVEALAEGIIAALERLREFDPSTIRRSVIDRFGRAAFVREITRVYDEVVASTVVGPTGGGDAA